jgi:hypothetical protein
MPRSKFVKIGTSEAKKQFMAQCKERKFKKVSKCGGAMIDFMDGETVVLTILTVRPGFFSFMFNGEYWSETPAEMPPTPIGFGKFINALGVSPA